MRALVVAGCRYSNVLSLPLMVAIMVPSGDLDAVMLDTQSWDISVLGIVFASCVVGTGISYSGWWCRSKVSATMYSVFRLGDHVHRRLPPSQQQ